METVCGRGGVRSGRAVVGLDVVSHTLPRNFRTPAHPQHPPPCCQPPTRPPHGLDEPPDEDEDDDDPSRCAECHPDLCPGGDGGFMQCPAITPYPTHLYPTVVRGSWGGPGVTDCTKCRLQASLPPCACPDPRCIGANTSSSSALVCGWGPSTLPHLHQQPVTTNTSYQDLQVTRAASVCALPKLFSVEERLTTALGHPLNTQSHPHKHPPPHSGHPTTPQHNQTPPQQPYNKTQSHNQLPHTRDDHNAHHHHHHAHGQSLGVAIGSRLSRSVESLPRDIKEHILKCQCTCDHLGYGNFSATSLHHLPGMSNGCSSVSTKTSSSHEELPPRR
ncbi:uncharacterized protein LOC121862242 [Homarus americanus]|uniref:uncharacterized protein LOC121862242 n=1 Tax=Homarus americanus TaxID=6706 RepID=UPI001C455668|nr:uncharacterized protein LOC121862242 [Homarus americanus]